MMIIKSIIYFTQVLAIVFIVLFIVNLLEKYNLFRKLINLLGPLPKVLNLPNEFCFAILLSLISPTASYSIISRFKNEYDIDDKLVLASLILTSPFTHLCDIIRLTIPIVISTLGIIAGTYYILLALLRVFIRFSIHLVISKQLSKYSQFTFSINKQVIYSTSREQTYRDVLLKTLRLYKKIVLRFGIITIIVLLLTYFGVFDYIGKFLSKSLSLLNEKYLTIIVTALANYISAIYLAGMFLNSNLLTIKDVLYILYLSQLITTPIMYFRSYLPYRLAFFSYKIVLRWIFIDLFSAMLSTLICLIIILLLL